MSPDGPPASSVGDLAQLGQLWAEHAPRLIAMLRGRINPGLGFTAEDVLQRTFLEARSKWGRFGDRGGLSPYAWLYRIARDCLAEEVRRATRDCRDIRRARRLPEASAAQIELGLMSPGSSPSTAAAREELREQMRQALEELRDTDQELLVMRHFDGLSYADIAGVLGVKENAAYVRYHRALGRLSEVWQRLHPDDGGRP